MPARRIIIINNNKKKKKKNKKIFTRRSCRRRQVRQDQGELDSIENAQNTQYGDQRFLSYIFVWKKAAEGSLSYFREKQKLRKIDHDARDEVNLLMDKWRPSDVLILMKNLRNKLVYNMLESEKECSKKQVVRKRKQILEHGDDEYDSDSDLVDLREDSVVPLTLDLHGFVKYCLS